MSDIQITPLKAFSDNYIWCLQRNEFVAVVDPGDAGPVLAYCQDNALQLVAILITHHHWDHIHGISELCKTWPGIPVYGPRRGNIDQLTHTLAQDERIWLDEIQFGAQVEEVPGHTLDHIAYVSKSGLFCGDTLFSAGCGRLFEGSAEQMHRSLNKLMQLSDDTPVYCTHEYTLSNLKFAQVVDPTNAALKQHLTWAEAQIAAGRATLPSTIGKEKAINPFLRAGEARIKQHVEQYVGRPLPDAKSTFAALRGWKDHF